jgi:hypothetical protein
MQLTDKLGTTWKLFLTRLSSTECNFTFSSTVFSFAIGSPHAVIKFRFFCGTFTNCKGRSRPGRTRLPFLLKGRIETTYYTTYWLSFFRIFFFLLFVNYY